MKGEVNGAERDRLNLFQDLHAFLKEAIYSHTFDAAHRVSQVPACILAVRTATLVGLVQTGEVQTCFGRQVRSNTFW